VDELGDTRAAVPDKPAAPPRQPAALAGSRQGPPRSGVGAPTRTPPLPGHTSRGYRATPSQLSAAADLRAAALTLEHPPGGSPWPSTDRPAAPPRWWTLFS
jgi:hypothetical protein